MRPCSGRQALERGLVPPCEQIFGNLRAVFKGTRTCGYNVVVSSDIRFPAKRCHISWKTYLDFEDEIWVVMRASETHEVRRLLESAVLRSFT
jgi:hypothetical protein